MDTVDPCNFGPEPPSTSRWTGKGGMWCWILTLIFCVVVGTCSTQAQSTTNKRISSGRLHTAVVRDDGTVWQWGYANFAPVQVTGLSGVVSVATGYDVSYALKSDGTVWTWWSPYYAPVQVSGLSNVVGLYSGYNLAVAVKSDGTVWTWGSNAYGQLGNGTTTDSSTPVQVSSLTDVVQVTAGQTHAMALKSDGTVWAWGSNVTGGLGNGTTTQSLTPVQVSNLTDVVSIAADGADGWSEHSLAVKDDGTVWAWGANWGGQLGDGTTTQRLAPVQVPGMSNVVEVEADFHCSQALKADGTLWAWGYNRDGQVGDETKVAKTAPVQVSGLSSVTAMSLGREHAAALRNDGAVFAWGLHTSGQLGDDNTYSRAKAVEIPGIDNVAKTASGERHKLALKKDGTVWSWGTNYYGELGDNTLLSRPLPAPVSGLSNIIAVAGGQYFSLALRADGSVWSWGYNQQGQLGHDNWANLQTPAAISGLTDVVAISTWHHAMAVKSNGTLWTWGSNWAGQLGDNSTLNKHAPVHITGVSDVIAAAAGGSFSLVLKSDGTVWAWGANSAGQLGDGTTTQRLTPVQVSGLTGVVAIAAGSEHGLALKSDGTVWGWGHNGHGQLDDGTTTNRSTPIQIPGLSGGVSIVAGAYNSAVVKSDGSMSIKGNNWGEQLGDGSPGHTIVHASAGMYNFVAVKESGTLISWGRNEFGEFGAGMPISPNATTPVLVPGVNVTDDAPSVAITSPANNTSVALGLTQTVTVGFTPGDGTAESVSLYYHGILIGTDDSAPYTFNFTPWTWGDFELHAVGRDSNGVYSNRSARIFIHTPYDSDSDGLPDWWEQKYFSTLAQSGSGETDADGLTNAQELANNTDPSSWDSDGDGYSDGFEIAHSTDPLNAGDIPALVPVAGRKRLAAGSTHMVAVREDGTVWAWGRNGLGQISDGPSGWLWPHLESVPVRVGTLTDITSVSAGFYHTLALKSDGTVWAWGSNGGGLFGDGTTNSSATPGQVQNLTGVVVAVAAGDAHSLALKDDGTVWAWGANSSGQIGDGTTAQRLTPVQVSGLGGIVAVAATENFSLALKSDGTVWAWGANGMGQLGDGTTTQRLTPVQVSGITDAVAVACRSAGGFAHAVALMEDDTVWTWGHNGYGELGDGTYTQRLTPVQVSGLSGIVEIDAGAWNTIAVKSDGTVWSWGFNNEGELGNGTKVGSNTPVQVTGIDDAVAVATGYGNSGAITSDGKIHMWGRHYYAQLGDDSTFASSAPVQSSGVTNVEQVAAGHAHTVAVKSDGTVWTWGVNYLHQLGDGTSLSRADPVQVAGLSDVVMAGANAEHSAVVKSDGTVWTWGYNWFGQLGDGTTTDRSTPVQVSGITSATQVAAGRYHGLALKSDGTVHAWGTNAEGQLGDNTTTQRLTSVEVIGLTNVAAIAAGGGHSMAMKSDGTVWAWGRNFSGQLGNNSTTDSPVPVQVSGLTGVIAIACGQDHSMALKSDGTLWAWGYNGQSQFDDGTTTNRTTPVQISGLNDLVSIGAGVNQSLAVRANGELWVKGGPSWVGQLGNGSTGHHLIAATGGGNLTLGLKEDGSLIVFGTNEWGQFGEGLPWNRETYSPIQVKRLNLLYEASELEITSPSSSPASVVLGQSQSITVGVTPGDSQPASVSLYHHGVLVGTDSVPPYTFSFTPWTWGNFELRAIGTDPLGQQTARSAPLLIQVAYDNDFDDDGLPDWWERLHHGTLAYSGNDDVDGDGLTEAGEYFNQTSPNQSDSDGDGTSDYDEFASAYGLVATNLQVVERQANAVKLTWQSSYGHETSFRVEKATYNGTSWIWSPAGTAPGDATSFTATGLPEKTEHQFRVVTVSPYANGTSATVSAATKPAKPSAPEALALLAANATEVQLSWQDVAGNETGYVVEGKATGGGSFSTVATTDANATSVTVGSLVGTTSYVFRVKAVNTDGVDTEYSLESSELTLPAMPDVPTGLSVQSALWNQAQLSWSLPTDTTRTAVRLRGYDNSGTVQRFQIDLAPDDLGYTDTGLVATTSYQYKVAAVNLRGESATALQSVTTMGLVPAAPSGVTATALGARALRVEWEDNANNETGYIVERSPNSGFSPVVSSPQLPANTTVYEDRVGLQGATTYYYRVMAVNGSGSSSYSSTASGATSVYPTANHVPDALGVYPDELALYGTTSVDYGAWRLVNGVLSESWKDEAVMNLGTSQLLAVRAIPATPAGAAPLNEVHFYQYTNATQAWAYNGYWIAPAGTGSTPDYGACIAISGTKMLISAPGAVNGSSVASGLVYSWDFSIPGGAPTVITPPSGSAGDQFGYSVAVDGNRLVIGAPGKDKSDAGGSITDAGAVYLYDWNGASWVYNRTEYSQQAQTSGKFGFSVSLSGRNFVVGAPYEDGWFQVGSTIYVLGDTGAVYFGKWEEPGELLGFNNLLSLYPEVQAKIAGLNNSHFGYSVSIDRALRVAVGTPDSTWTAGDGMSNWDRGTVMIMQWNGKLGEDYSFAVSVMTDSSLSAGARFGEYVEEEIGFDLAVGTGLRSQNRPGSYYCYLGFVARPGEEIGGTEILRRVGDMLGFDEDEDPLAFSIPSSSNPLGTHFEIDAGGVLKAKDSLSGTPLTLYPLSLAVSDDRGGALTKTFQIEIVGGASANDQDGDGIDDAWELANGLDPNNGSDALWDLDGDGYTALEEYHRSLSSQAYGTNPGAWDLDPNGDIDGDGVLNKQDANPHDPTVGQMAVQITAPGDSETL